MTAGQSSDKVTLTSTDTSLNSSVIVTPGVAATSPRRCCWPRLGRGRGLGLRAAATGAGGARGAARRRARTAAPSARTTSSRTAARRHLRARSLLFPRFNLLCLPGLTSDDDVAGAAGPRLLQGRARVPRRGQPGGRLRRLSAQPRRACRRSASTARSTTRALQVVEALPAARPDAQPARVRRRGGGDGADRRSRGIWKAPAGMEAGIVAVSDLTKPHRRQPLRACSTRRASTSCAPSRAPASCLGRAHAEGRRHRARRSSSTCRSGG